MLISVAMMSLDIHRNVSAESVTLISVSRVVMDRMTRTVPLAKSQKRSKMASVKTIVDQICTRRVVAALRIVGFPCSKIQVIIRVSLAPVTASLVNSGQVKLFAQSVTLHLFSTR